MAWKHYSEMIVWQKSMDLVVEIYRLVKMLPVDERYALSEQMRRAAVSIPSNIAEGESRKTDKEFKHFFSIAKGSVSEVETQLFICRRINYLTEEQIQNSVLLCQEVRRMITKLIQNYTTISDEN